MVKIGNVELQGNLTLGPMAGVTDFAFRGVCHALGAALTTTEMVSARALTYQNYCTFPPTSTPVQPRSSGMSRK